MEPISTTALVVGSGAVGVVSALGQWLNSQEAQAATAQERARVQAIFDKLKSPDLDSTAFTPEDYKIVGKYIPSVAPYIAEIAPQTVKADTADAVAGRDAQKEALQRLIETSRAGGMGDQLLQSQFGQANLAAAQAQQSQRSTLDSQMARRGQLGSGMQYAMQLAGGANPQMQAARSGENQAAEAYRAKLQALTGAANLGGQIRGEDVALNQSNAGIINAFNQRMADSMRANAMNQQNVQNTAQTYNLDRAQKAADLNVGNRNNATMRNQDLRNRNAQQTFDNQMGIARGKAGLSGERVNDILGNAQQANQTLQSITDIGMGAAASQMRQNQYDDDRARMDKYYDRLFKGGTEADA